MSVKIAAAATVRATVRAIVRAIVRDATETLVRRPLYPWSLDDISQNPTLRERK
jgi:hypothetical protein